MKIQKYLSTSSRSREKSMDNSKVKSIKKTFKVLLVFLTFAFYLLTFYVSSAWAQSIPLQVAPARQQIFLNPGESTAVTVKFFNLGETPISGIVKAADFIVDNTQGEPKILENVDQATPKFSAASWITIPYETINIAANDRVSFQAKITVPADARPGGRYAAVYFETTGAVPAAGNKQQQAGIGMSHRIASLFYIRVNGPILEQALVSKFFAKSFYEYGPIDLDAEILNRGDYHIRPKGYFALTNMFNGVADQTNLKEQNIFPDAARSFTAQLGKKWMMGRYKVSLTAGYGDKGHVLERFTYVWVFPWRIALIIILTLIILFILGRHFYFNLMKKESILEEEIRQEQEEIEKLKEELRKKRE